MLFFSYGRFFAVSGFVSGRRFADERSDVPGTFIRKVKRLLIPYLFLSYASLLPKIFLNAYARNPVDADSAWKILLGRSPDGSLWYLYILFAYSLFTQAVLFLTERLGKKGKCICVSGIAVVFYLLGEYLKLNTETTAARWLRYYIFYVIGILIFVSYEKIKDYFVPAAAAFAVLSIVILTCPFKGWKCPYLITALLGIYAVLAVSISIEKKGKAMCRALSRCGDNSYAIYILSYYVQQFVRVFCFRYMGWAYLLVVFLEAVLGLSLTLYFAERILPKSRLLKILLIGEWPEETGKDGKENRY